MTNLQLITVEEYEEPLVKASELSVKLGYAKKDGVSNLVNSRAKDFESTEAFLFTTSTGTALYLSESGALKVCMFSDAEKAQDIRNEIIDVYKSWRRGDYYTSRQLTPAEQALLQAKNILNIAQQQVVLEREVSEQKKALEMQKEEIDQTKDQVKRLESKVDLISKRKSSTSDGVFISEEQASELSQSVKLIAFELSKRTKQNEYASVYGQLYRQFGVTSYKRMPVEKFDNAMTFLTEWYNQAKQESTTDGVQFEDLPF